MLRLIFDIETNGLLDDLSTIHIITAMNADTGEQFDYKPDQITEGLALLSSADVLIGHNIIKFDIPALQKVYPDFAPKGKLIDTLVISRLIWSDLSDRDHANIAKGKGMIGKYVGSHALAAWGMRLGTHKGDYDGGWEEWNEEMHSYAIQDTVVTDSLWKLIEKKEYSQQAIELELKVADIMARCERKGFGFDVDAANSLAGELVKVRAQLEAELQDVFVPWYSAVEVVTPKRTINYKNKPSVTAGAAYTKVKLNVFNAGSRQHIANRLVTMFGWKPKAYNANGTPKVDETTLLDLKYPQAQPLVKFLTVQKRLGQLAEGKQAWLNAEKDGRIHAQYITNGAVTGRAIHRFPNIAQVPSTRALWGKESRALFVPSKGRVLVGVDQAGVELRCLAHYMAKFDNGAYGKEVLDGDIHTVNQHAAGLETRDQSKTFIYAFLYGAGSQKLGSIVGKGATHGQRLKDRFLNNLPALGSLIKAVQKAATRGYLKGLDGRNITVRSPHAALNTLLQGAGALLAKQWLVEFDNLLTENNLQHKADLVAWVHDEVQIESDPDVSEEVKDLAIKAAAIAGEHFEFRIQIDADGSIGNNWCDTH